MKLTTFMRQIIPKLPHLLNQNPIKFVEAGKLSILARGRIIQNSISDAA